MLADGYTIAVLELILFTGTVLEIANCSAMKLAILLYKYWNLGNFSKKKVKKFHQYVPYILRHFIKKTKFLQDNKNRQFKKILIRD